MAQPKKRTSKSKRNMRRSHDNLSRTYSIVCPNCGASVLRHRVCRECGEYKGRQIIEIVEE